MFSSFSPFCSWVPDRQPQIWCLCTSQTWVLVCDIKFKNKVALFPDILIETWGLCPFFESCDSSSGGVIKGHRAPTWLPWYSHFWGSTETAMLKESHVGAVVCGLSRACSQHLGWPTAMRAAILDRQAMCTLSSNHSPADI